MCKIIGRPRTRLIIGKDRIPIHKKPVIIRSASVILDFLTTMDIKGISIGAILSAAHALD